MLTVNDYCKQLFGQKVYKISLNAGLTCPNRDGSCGTRGCIFCSAGGSGEFAADCDKDITAQIADAKQLIAKKFKGNKFIAYFGSFTNTYASVSYLEKIFTECITDNSVVALSIATRPDCLGDDIIDLISRLNNLKPVWVELGLQTIHEDTARYIRRGYSLSVYDEAMERLKQIGVHIITHVILGLPGETPEQMLSTVDYAVKKGTNGIKLQLLHILKGTDLYKEYINGKVSVMSREEYIDILIKSLKIIPENVVVHRLTGDGPKSILDAPLWSADKKSVINAINKAITDNNL